MDVRFTRLPSGALEREVYRKLKPTHTNRYIHADSHQPMNVKSAVDVWLICIQKRPEKKILLEMPFWRTRDNTNDYGGERIQKKICKQGYHATNSPKRSIKNDDRRKQRNNKRSTAFHRRTEPGGKNNCERGEHTMHVYRSKHSAETA